MLGVSVVVAVAVATSNKNQQCGHRSAFDAIWRSSRTKNTSIIHMIPGAINLSFPTGDTWDVKQIKLDSDAPCSGLSLPLLSAQSHTTENGWSSGRYSAG